VVAADALALPHLVYSGLNGFLYPPGDVDALSERIAEIAGAPAKRVAMGEASRHVIARHDLGRTLEIFEELYRGVANLPRPIVLAKEEVSALQS
jgi:glycosyltransferase involved in cell wall biosynthesis